MLLWLDNGTPKSVFILLRIPPHIKRNENGRKMIHFINISIKKKENFSHQLKYNPCTETRLMAKGQKS